MSKRVLAVGTIRKGTGGTATQRTTHTVNTGKGYSDHRYTSTRRFPTSTLAESWDRQARAAGGFVHHPNEE